MSTVELKDDLRHRVEGQKASCSLLNSVSEAELRAASQAHPVLSVPQRQRAGRMAHAIVEQARGNLPRLSIEKLLVQYRLAETEGRLLMELAEALLRVPDVATQEFLIRDKLAAGHWMRADATGFMRGATMALATAGRLSRAVDSTGLGKFVGRLGVPVIRRALRAAMLLTSRHFVFAETIETAVIKASRSGQLFSFDMLGETARTDAVATRYFKAYETAIGAVSRLVHNQNPQLNSGISIKLSALHPRFRTRYWSSCCPQLTAKVRVLARLAKAGNIPLTLDAEELARLQPTLEIVADLLAQSEFAGWDGLGIVVQAYGRQTKSVLDWLVAQAKLHHTRIAVRLVKGAYWDSEIKVAQEKGLTDFPVLTHKETTELAYLTYASQMLVQSEWIYSQFASHNAFSLAAIVQLADAWPSADYEVQKLHGMGDEVHAALQQLNPCRSRTYAPIGTHEDLLAYLIRRLLENGANSSFLYKLSNPALSSADLVQDPYDILPEQQTPSVLRTGTELFLPHHRNSIGFDLDDRATLNNVSQTLAEAVIPKRLQNASVQQLERAFARAQKTQLTWRARLCSERADIIEAIADLYEQHAPQFFRLLAMEAGKTFDDAVAELREAVDFCRFYAAEARLLTTGDRPRGIVVCISPWNFPLAIFTGQIVAGLVTGNAVIAKPAEQTPVIAKYAVSLMYRAGVPEDLLHCLVGSGEELGQAMIAVGQADLVVFTGSTKTAKVIEQTLANSTKPTTPLIAETGGINAMIVDSSALLERAVDDIITSAFRSAGQRCSALRVLYIQEEIEKSLLTMLLGAAKKLQIGDPRHICVDIGPVINAEAKLVIDNHVRRAEVDGTLIWQSETPANECYCGPAIVRVAGIEHMEREIFGPVLHVASYPAGAEGAVAEAINQSGYGLTFGMHSRIHANINRVISALEVGNCYINRNQIGAIVGSQPFGGHGLSGTGPKAGGHLYLKAFIEKTAEPIKLPLSEDYPGPNGEQNRCLFKSRGAVLCLHPDQQVRTALRGCAKLAGNRLLEADSWSDQFDDVDAVLTVADGSIDLARLRRMLARSAKRILPLLIMGRDDVWLWREQHICEDLTVFGGDLALLSQ